MRPHIFAGAAAAALPPRRQASAGEPAWPSGPVRLVTQGGPAPAARRRRRTAQALALRARIVLRAADRVIRLDALSPEQLRDLDQLYHSTRDVRVATARLNGLDPEAYLRRVLGHIADHPIYRVAELLPRNLAGKHPSAAT